MVERALLMAIEVLSRRIRAVGNEVSRGIEVPLGAKTVTLSVDRLHWPLHTSKPVRTPAGRSDEVVRLTLQISDGPDGPWQTIVGCGTPGGDGYDKDGVLATKTSVSTELPQKRGLFVRGRLQTRIELETACHIGFDL